MGIRSCLPVELEDIILDYIRRNEDYGGLKACSTVCKSWRPRAQCQLYNHIVLEGSADEDYRFYDHIQEYPALCDYVRELSISGPSCGATLAKLLSRLLRLEHLNLPNGVSLHEPTNDPEKATWLGDFLLSIFSMQHLRTLSMYASFPDDPKCERSDEELLARVTGLQRLQSADIGVLHTRTARPTILLQKAVLQVHGAPSQTNPSPLRRLGIILCRRGDDPEWMEKLKSINVLLDSIGPRLELLMLDVYLLSDIGHEMVEDVLPRVHLAQCANLRTIEINLRWDDDDHWESEIIQDPRQRALDAAEAILSSLPPTAPLDSVVLRMEDDVLARPYFPLRSEENRRALLALDDRLCSLPHLQYLTIEAADGEDPQMVHAWIVQSLSRVKTKADITVFCDLGTLDMKVE